MASDPTAKGDELGRTATAPLSSSAPAPPAEPIGATVGRYRLERELGEGGMGVVHAAFDPDLQRRVALKVLRVAASGTQAKDRLLREARAMARLAHPNVVTVHEVGTASGRDYVAMELISGETLADWLRSERRRQVDIVAAFVAAGRGLAAAHAAGIVHRDFKPHNVLRSRQGRIVVTDFGLAREAQAALPVQLDVTLPLSARVIAPASGTPSSLDGITVTGSLLGTPAYMAPEQWGGGLVTPATDQFAFCVGLWEALAGERPYRGPTLEDLRQQAALGPSALDASSIPRRLRVVLRRGLDPDPARRWPNMDALLARLVRAERRPGIALAIAGGALVGAAVLVVALRAGGQIAPRPGCPPPVLDPAQVWSVEARALGAQTVAGKQLAADMASWTAERAAACQVEPVARVPRLACLDGVLARIDAVARAVKASSQLAQQVDAGIALVDPKVCELARPPRLMTAMSTQLHDVLTRSLALTTTPVPLSKQEAGELVKRAAADPCASSLAHLLAADVQQSAAERRTQIDEAHQDAERCGDDRLLADNAIEAAQAVFSSEWLSAGVTTQLRLADAAVQRVAQPDLIARIDRLRSDAAQRAEDINEAIKRGTAAMDGFAARGRLRFEIATGLATLSLRQIRGSDADRAAIPELLTGWRRRAVAELGESDDVVRAIDGRVARRAFYHGDIVKAHAELQRAIRPLPNDPAQRITGIVVDPRGRPVAGATVSTGWELRGDSISAVSGLGDNGSLRSATTDADGRFDIPDAAVGGVVIAERGELRSSASLVSDSIKLELEPTARIEGRVDLRGEPASNVAVYVKDLARSMAMQYAIVAPVAADGSFTIDGVPRHDVRVLAGVVGPNTTASGGSNVQVSGPVVRGVALALAKSNRVLHVLVRNKVNTPLANAEIVVIAGKMQGDNAAEINERFRGGSSRFGRQLEGEQAPKLVIGVARPGDLYATLTDVPEGVATVCAIGLPDMSDSDLERKLIAHFDKIPATCQPIPDKAEVVTILVDPLPRLD